MPHDTPVTRKPIGGAIRNPPIALNSINENISVFAKVTRLSLDFKEISIFFITHQPSAFCDILIELIGD